MTTIDIYVSGQHAEIGRGAGGIQPVIGSGGSNEVIVDYHFAAAVSGTFYGVYKREDSDTEYKIASSVTSTAERKCTLPAAVYADKGRILCGGVMVSGSNQYTIEFVPVDVFKGFRGDEVFAIPMDEIDTEPVTLKAKQGTLKASQGALKANDFQDVLSHNHSII